MALDNRVTIATPEGVTLELVLAGLGSRFMARLLDTLIQLTIIFALTLGIGALAVFTPGVALAVFAILSFLVLFIYDVPFELLNNGRTLGKMAAGIRVVGQGGRPVGAFGSCTRNVLRIADFLPVFYVTGVCTIMTTKHDQRLGDLAAGTLVVRDKFPGLESLMSPPLTVPAEAVSLWDVSAVDAGDLATIRHFLDRRVTLPWPVRTHFGTELAARVGPKVPGAPYPVHPEYLLEGVVVAKQRRA